MLINSPSVAQAPSRPEALAPSCCAATAGPRQLPGFGLGVVVGERGQAGVAAQASTKSGIWRGGNYAAAENLPGFGGSLQTGQLAANPAQARPIQAGVVTKSTVQNSTDHNYNQMARLVPASRGVVGPHPGREPRPA